MNTKTKLKLKNNWKTNRFSCKRGFFFDQLYKVTGRLCSSNYFKMYIITFRQMNRKCGTQLRNLLAGWICNVFQLIDFGTRLV